MQRFLIVCSAILLALFSAGHSLAAGPDQTTPAASPRPASPLNLDHIHLAPTLSVARSLPSLAAPLAGASKPLLYNGGPVMHQSVNHAIFWLPSGYHFESSGQAAGDTRFENLITRYFQDIGQSDFYRVLFQYPDSAGAPQNVSSFGGATIDTSAYPTAGDAANPLSDFDIQSAVSRALSNTSLGWAPGITQSFTVFTAYGIVSCADAQQTQCSNSTFCGYHGDYLWRGQEVIYTNMPDLGSMLFNGCGVHNTSGQPQSPNGDPTADAEINVLSHEHFESANDPEPTAHGAWWDIDGNEIGDKCGWIFGSFDANQANIYLNGHPYTLQQEWSNAANGCVQAYYSLRFATQPGGATPNAALSPQPVVQAVSVTGAVVSSFTGQVSVKLKPGTAPGNAGLFPSSPIVASLGVASFHGLYVNVAGAGMVMTASSPFATSVDSTSFTIGASQPPAGTLTVTTQPAGATAGQAFTTQPVVSLLDSNSQPITSFNGTVTLAIKSGTPGAILSGGSAVAASGVASFSGLSIDKAGNGYVLTASAAGYSPVDTSAFTVAAGAPPADCSAATLSASPPGSTTVGTSVTLTASATGCGTPQYRFTAQPGSILIHDWQAAVSTNWSTSGQPAGGYTLKVEARNQGSAATPATQTISYQLNAAPPPPPSISSLSVTSGSAAGGTAVTVTGQNLTGAAATVVRFGPNAATGVSCTATSCAVTSPAGSGTVDVTATVDGQTSATSNATKFAYAAAVSTATIVTPVPGTTLTGASVTFTLNRGTASMVYLYIGSSVGSPAYYGQPVSGTTANVTKLPTNGSTVYARVWSLMSGSWVATDYTYTAAGAAGGGGVVTPGTVQQSSPTNNATGLTQPVPLSWIAPTGAGGGTTYTVSIRAGAGGSGASMSPLPATSGLSASIPLSEGLLAGQTYAWNVIACNDSAHCSAFNATWFSFTIMAAGGGGGGGTGPATMISPAPGSALGGTATFTWAPNGTSAPYNLYVGNYPGSADIYTGSGLSGTSVTVSLSRASGNTVYVRLLSFLNGSWQIKDYTYATAQNGAQRNSADDGTNDQQTDPIAAVANAVRDVLLGW